MYLIGATFVKYRHVKLLLRAFEVNVKDTNKERFDIIAICSMVLLNYLNILTEYSSYIIFYK